MFKAKEKEIINNFSYQERKLNDKDYALECLKLSVDLMKSTGKKRFKDEFFDETKLIAENFYSILMNGKTLDEVEKLLNTEETSVADKEATKQ